jgi:hypothetical protein
LGVLTGSPPTVTKVSVFVRFSCAVQRNSTTSQAWPFDTDVSAIAYALVNAANMIDGTWTLAVEQQTERGRACSEFAFFSQAGNRPVTLIGFWGSHVYSCLKESSLCINQGK